MRQDVARDDTMLVRPQGASGLDEIECADLQDDPANAAPSRTICITARARMHAKRC
jgi:hypothetical protein